MEAVGKSLKNTPTTTVQSTVSKDNMPYEIAFWMCAVASILLIIYVKITEALQLHWIFVIYSVAVASLIVSRYVFFMLEKPTLLAKGKYLPTIHAVVTCLNESKSVYSTVKSIFKSNYPKNKINITVVDDGKQTRNYKELMAAINKGAEDNFEKRLPHEKEPIIREDILEVNRVDSAEYTSNYKYEEAFDSEKFREKVPNLFPANNKEILPFHNKNNFRDDCVTPMDKINLEGQNNVMPGKRERLDSDSQNRRKGKIIEILNMVIKL